MSNDADLLQHYATRRDERAFAELVRRHVDLVYSVALRMVGGDAHAAKDVAQAVFLALAREASSLRRKRTLAGWLYLTTHHLAAQRVRSDCRRHNREQQAHLMHEIHDGPDIEWHRIRPVLDDTMAELNDTERELVVLRYFEQKPFREIGRALAISEDAARMRVDRALEKLRTILARRGVSSTAAALGTVLGSQITAAPAGLAAAITDVVTAGAVPTAGALSVFSTIMSTSTIITSTVALVALGTAAYQYSTAHHLAAALGVADQNRAALQAQLNATENRLNQSTRQIADLQRATAARPATITKAALASGSSAPAPEPASVQEERRQKVSAEVRQGEIQHAVAQYAPLFKKLDLSESQTAAFKALLLDYVGKHYDLGSVAQSEDLSPTDPDVAAVQIQSDADLANRIRTQFGDAVFQAFQHFNETAPVRELAGQLTQALAGSVTPLTPAQADQLVEILNRNRIPRPDGQLTGDPHALNLDAAMAQAQAILSPSQLAALRAIHAERR